MMGEMRRPVAQPLHEQVRHLIIERIERGEWSPGTYLPSEIHLASEYAVSVGTVRKSLLELTQEGILQRRQGKGTVVSSYDDDESLFRFFNVRREDGTRVRPESRVLSCIRRPAMAADSKALRIDPSADVICIERIRHVEGAQAVFERITLSADRFGALETDYAVLPNTLYKLYQTDFQATVHQVTETLVAGASDKKTSSALGILLDTPILLIKRVASDYQGQPIERRLSWLRTDGLCYYCTM